MTSLSHPTDKRRNRFMRIPGVYNTCLSYSTDNQYLRIFLPSDLGMQFWAFLNFGDSVKTLHQGPEDLV